MDKIEKFLARLSLEENQKMRNTMCDIVNRQLSYYDVKKLQGQNHLYRARVGRYRIIFYMDDALVYFVNVTKKNDRTYKNL